MTTATPRVRRVEGLLPERAVLGLTLLAIGTIVLAASVIPGVDRYTLLGVSAVTLIAFAISREYGFAIVAGITGGLGAMVVLTSSGAFDPVTTGAVFFVSIASGFASVWVLGLLSLPRETSPWPLAPAAVLGTLGILVAAKQPAAFDWVQIGVASILVIGGTAMFIRRGQH